jgi:ATP synthase protein I
VLEQRVTQLEHRTHGYKGTAWKIVAAQILVTLVLAMGLLLGVSVRSSYSALLGGGISTISSLYLVDRLFRFPEGTPPDRIIRAFYTGEAVKLFLVTALFAVAIVFLNVDFLFMLLAFIFTLPVYWFALLMGAPD